jgi:hypothetical protein
VKKKTTNLKEFEAGVVAAMCLSIGLSITLSMLEGDTRYLPAWMHIWGGFALGALFLIMGIVCLVLPNEEVGPAAKNVSRRFVAKTSARGIDR